MSQPARSHTKNIATVYASRSTPGAPARHGEPIFLAFTAVPFFHVHCSILGKLNRKQVSGSGLPRWIERPGLPARSPVIVPFRETWNGVRGHPPINSAGVASLLRAIRCEDSRQDRFRSPLAIAMAVSTGRNGNHHVAAWNHVYFIPTTARRE